MPAEMKKKFDNLEKKIENLISSHLQLKALLAELKDENRRLEEMLEQERARVARTDAGYKHLRENERTKNKGKIKAMKMRINGLVGEIDKSIALISSKK